MEGVPDMSSATTAAAAEFATAAGEETFPDSETPLDGWPDAPDTDCDAAAAEAEEEDEEEAEDDGVEEAEEEAGTDALLKIK